VAEPVRLRSRLRQGLAKLEPGLRVLAEDVLGLETSLDLVGADASGRLVLVLVAEPGRELEAIADALAQSCFLAPRVKDWRKLAPELPLDPERGVRALVVSPDFCARARAAAEAIGRERIELVRSRPATHDGAGELELRRATEGAAQPLAERSPRWPAGEGESAFRTGLGDADLGLCPAERAALRSG
jgi:hypothetical protein